MKHFIFTLLLLMSLVTTACADKPLTMGAERTKEYLPQLEGKRVAVLANHTAMAGEEHLVDMLVREKVNLVGIFSPEHGFRGGADAGEHVKSSVDEKTGFPSGRSMMASRVVLRMRRCRRSMFCWSICRM